VGDRLLRTSYAGALLTTALLLASCGGGGPSPTADTDAQAPTTSSGAAEPSGHGHSSGAPTDTRKAPTPRPLRAGERHLVLEMPEAYEPAPPTRAATDDYRCFLLDPGLQDDVFVTGTDVLPGNPKVVHHVILFRVPPDQVADAEQLDAATEGQGWTCFGDSGLRAGPGTLDDAPWLGAWAPGGGESVLRAGYGSSLERGSRVVMQVHYNLLAGDGEDVSATRLRVAPAGARLAPVSTMLLPAPVELPCRPGRRDSPLCDRDAALADVEKRVGYAGAADWLHVLCGTPVAPSQVTRCDRRVKEPTTVLGAAGHMHLLGTKIRIEVNPGRPDTRRILDIPVWNFDDQGARPIRPTRLRRGDTVRVTCHHSQDVRDHIPAFDGQPDRYVVWGEGTSDEMCLGVLQVAPSRDS
jgi:hypothetical protein